MCSRTNRLSQELRFLKSKIQRRKEVKTEERGCKINLTRVYIHLFSLWKASEIVTKCIVTIVENLRPKVNSNKGTTPHSMIYELCRLQHNFTTHRYHNLP